MLALVLAVALYPLLSLKLGVFSLSLGAISQMALRETVVGFMMGFTVYVTFEALNLAAQFIATQMGLSAAGMVDPQNHTSTPVLVPFQGWLVLMTFLFTDMHHQLIRLFVMSYDATAGFTGETLVSAALYQSFTVMSGKLFVLAVQMAAPFTLMILACNAAVGILARLMPQMNIILFAFPVTILLGLAGLYLLAPDMLSFIENVLGEVWGEVANMLRVM